MITLILDVELDVVLVSWGKSQQLNNQATKELAVEWTTEL